MSMEVHVFMERSQLPSIEAWQASIASNGFDMLLQSNLPIMEHRGFTSVLYKGNETGFELSASPASMTIDAYPYIDSAIGGRDLSIVFTWGGDLQECAAAIVSAAVLTVLADGLLYDPQQDGFHGKEDAISMAKQTLAEIEGYQTP